MQPISFRFGVTYWPQRAGFNWWQAFDRGELRDDLARIAGFGLNSLRFCLRWEDVQPGPDRVDSRTLRRFEQALDAAAAAGLGVVAVLFPLTIGGGLHLPGWASRADSLAVLQPPQRPRLASARATRSGQRLRGVAPTRRMLPAAPAFAPVIYAGGYHRQDARDLFADQALRAAQRYLVRELTGYFNQHPALAAWQLGAGLERTRLPTSAEAVGEWYHDLAGLVRDQPGSVQTIGVTSAVGLSTPAGPRPDQLVAACDMAGLSLDMPLPLPNDHRPRVTRLVFSYLLAARLAGRPLLVDELGRPTMASAQPGRLADEWYGRRDWSYPLLAEAHAEYLAAALQQLWQIGAQGVFLASYADYPPALWRTPPLDHSIGARTLGLIDTNGREKPVVAALQAFASRLGQPPTAAPASHTLEVDPDRYWHSPARESLRLWREFAEEDG